MFVTNKSQKPNILRRKTEGRIHNMKLTAKGLTLDNMLVGEQKETMQEFNGLPINFDNNTDKYDVIDSKHNISLVHNNHNNEVPAQSSEESLVNVQFDQVQFLNNDAQNLQFNLCNVVSFTQPQNNLDTCSGSQVENLCTKTVILEKEILGNSKTMKYTCEKCNKHFISEKKFIRHKGSHNKDITRPAKFDCPARIFIMQDVREPCGRSFLVRNDLLKHLNEDHPIEDAHYECGKCSRRFFWSLGLTGHGRGGCGRGELRCGWLGCGRSFQQPCRLREHMRAHTGEKPYRCHFPGCGAVFRSASKLRRHSPRHTGERRHACVCGRAFYRRDHLADHQAHTCPAKLKARSLAPETDPDDPFQPVSHQITIMPDLEATAAVESITTAVIEPSDQTESIVTSEGDYGVVVEMLGKFNGSEGVMEAPAEAEIEAEVEAEEEVKAEAEAEAEADSEVECQSARTHRTWPLTRSIEPDASQHDQIYVFEEGIKVEMAEENSNNIYTIRSDLFLHGNVLNNEDSEMITTAQVGTEVQTAAPLDHELSLLDSHPTTDLMQEELLYTNVTIDDSLFRVFYLSEEFAAPSPS